MRFVTAGLISGGFCGHKFKDQLTARIASVLYDLVYVHNPFPQDLWDEHLWNPFLNFGENHIQIWQIDWSYFHNILFDKTAWGGLDLDYVKKVIDVNTRDNTFFIFTESARILLEQISQEHRNSIVNTLREKYWNRRLTDPVVSYFNPDKLNVAIHIRRGSDVNPGGIAHYSRYTPDSYYLAIIENLKRHMPNLDVHIYSEGGLELFSEFLKLKDVYVHSCLKQDYPNLFITFHHMITSDILVNASSEFSYFTSYMNPNLTITSSTQEACKLAPDERHLISTPDGEFDGQYLKNCLKQRGKI